MTGNNEKSLKSQNMKWLVLLAIADAMAVIFFLVPEVMDPFTVAAVWRALGTLVMPVIVILTINVIPHEVKSMLVYWKPLGVLPGCKVFTKYGPADRRINMAALKNNVGAWPTDPPEQNAFWYKLYKMIPNEPEVVDAHKQFLMYRDMAVLSLGLILLTPVTLYIVGTALSASLPACGLFAVQYLVTAVSARWSGIRFVCNVLAVHSARPIPMGATR